MAMWPKRVVESVGWPTACIVVAYATVMLMLLGFMFGVF